MPTVEQTGREMLEAVKDGKIPLLAKIVGLEEPWRFRVLKALPTHCRNWKVKPNPHLPAIKARLQASWKRAKPPKDPARVLPGVVVEDGELVSVSFKYGGAVETLNVGEKQTIPMDMAVFAMTRYDVATGERIALLVDEGYEGPAVTPSAGSPGEQAPVEKKATDAELLGSAQKAGLVNELDDAKQPGWYYGSDVDSGIFLGKDEKAALRALNGKHKAVKEALVHQVG